MAKAQRWVVWTLKNVPGKHKPSKVPLGHANDPKSWTFYAAARAVLDDPKIAGLGFQMYGAPGVVGIDVDNCVESGQYNSLASQLLATLSAAGGHFHVELTPSGKGLRIFTGEAPLPFHDYLNNDAGVEVYTGESARFLTFTGKIVPGFGDGPFDPLPEASIALLGKYTKKWKAGIKNEIGIEGPPAPDVPTLTRREDWQKLHPHAIKRLGVEHRTFLENGALGKKYASASEHLFAVEQALLKHLKAPQAYQLLISADGSWGVALEHRENNERKACEFIWNDLQRAENSKEKHEKDKASAEAGWKDCDILVELTEDGARARILQINQINALQKHPMWINRLGYNVFDGRVTLDRADCTVRQLAEMSAWLTEFLKWPFEPRREQFEESVAEAAKTRPWNPVAEELRGYVWDGKVRVKKFAKALVGDEPAKVDVDILRKWLVGFVARGIEPGCQMDTVLCLREKEGGGFKTTFARAMAGSLERFSDSPGFGTDKDSSMLRGGMRIVELGEGSAVKRSDRHALKADMTRLDDHFRPPWGRVTEKRKRGFVYILTANDIAFLRSDQDGLRRIWPMDVREIIDITWIKDNREQLLAEAVALYDAGERWWWDKEHEPHELKMRQMSSVAEDFLDAAVGAVIIHPDNRERGYTNLLDIKKLVEAVSGTVLSAGQSQHLIDVLNKHGFHSERRRVDGPQVRVWTHPSWQREGGLSNVLPFSTPSAGFETPETVRDGGGVSENDE